MTDTIDTTETEAPLDSQAEYEALRDSQDEGAPEEIIDPEAEETEPEQKAEAPDVEKLQKSIRNRSEAVRRERERASAAEQRAAELEARLAALEGKANDDPLAALKEDDSDPIGDLEALKRWVRGQAQSGDQEKAARAQAQQQQGHVKQLSDWAAAYEDDFKVDHPDYDEAAGHVAESRRNELKLLHGDDQKAEAAFMQEMLALVAECRKTNRDPAEVVYQIAQQRGYGRKAVSIDNAAAKAEVIKRGQQASKSLGSAGKSEPSELSIESVNAIKDPTQRYAAYEKMKAQELRREQYG